MKKELNLLAPGEHKKQWYEGSPDRLQEEIRLMQVAYPDFTIYQKAEENIYWVGKAQALRPDGSILYSLEIKVECSSDYPETFPVVSDTKGALKDKKCPHLNRVDNTLCYGNRLDSQIDFKGVTRVKDVVDYVGIFLARQWYFEQYGDWPDGQPHGSLAFLEHEIKNVSLDPYAPCACGLSPENYWDCHMRDSWQILFQCDRTLDKNLRANIKLRSGRNMPCLCGSSRKYKKCCLHRMSYPSSKTFLLLKFPTAFGWSEEEVNKLFQSIISPGPNVTH